MEFLPLPPRRDWLLAALAELVQRAGPVPLLHNPILRQHPRDFPDPWSPDVAGVTRLLQRLLRQAGLVEARVTVSIEGDAAFRRALLSPTREPQDVAGWYAGVDAWGRHQFGVRSSCLTDPVQAVAVLGHEVAHAWRHAAGLVVPNQDEEELLTDVSTVYLGFGVFTANAAHRHVSQVVLGGSTWTTSTTGYLSMQDFGWLLAAQALVRGAGWWERFRLGRELTPNPRACFHRAHAALSEDADATCARILAAATAMGVTAGSWGRGTIPEA